MQQPCVISYNFYHEKSFTFLADAVLNIFLFFRLLLQIDGEECKKRGMTLKEVWYVDM